MEESRVKLLGRQGQSLWYDNISRAVIRGGALAAMVAEGVGGVTSNPTIFQKAIAEGRDYDGDILRLHTAGKPAEAIVQTLIIGDIREAADILRPVWNATAGVDGYVSIECNPHLANDTRATIEEAVHLFAEVGRPNVMIKIPGTDAGLPAVREVLARGINVNITLLFSPAYYRRTAEAYLDALDDLARDGRPLAGVHSVASFFISRIDSAVDKSLDSQAASAKGDRTTRLQEGRGKAAVAVAGETYAIFRELFRSDRFTALAARGANIQRPLWASTGTKDPAYPDVKYVDALIGPHTVNTVPQATLDAFRDHGTVAETITAAMQGAPAILRELADLGIDLDAVYSKLQAEGVRSFIESWDALVAAMARKAG
jgi:transaldolase